MRAFLCIKQALDAEPTNPQTVTNDSAEAPNSRVYMEMLINGMIWLSRWYWLFLVIGATGAALRFFISTGGPQ